MLQQAEIFGWTQGNIQSIMSDSGLLFPGISNPYICYADQNFDVDPKLNFATKIPELFMNV